MMPNTIEDGIC